MDTRLMEDDLVLRFSWNDAVFSIRNEETVDGGKAYGVYCEYGRVDDPTLIEESSPTLSGALTRIAQWIRNEEDLAIEEAQERV